MSGTPAPEKKIDIDLLVKEWSPEERREDRTARDKSKVLSTIQGQRPMVGGDFLVNEKGEAVTLAFAFEGPNGERYGLTVYHIWKTKRDPVFAFSSNIPSPSSGNLPLHMVGEIVAFSEKTDSMIFQFLPDAKLDLCKVMISPKTVLDLSGIDWSWLARNQSEIDGEQKLCGFGAQRRGTAGIVAGRFGQNDHHALHENDISVDSFNEGKNMISHDGDCGMIYFDEPGFPWSMHHVLSVSGKGTADETCRSWGTPLKSIVKAHHKYIGIGDDVLNDSVTEFTNLQAMSPKTGSGIIPGAARFHNVEFLAGEEPNTAKYVTEGPGAIRFANVEIVSGQHVTDIAKSDMTNSCFTAGSS